MIDNMTTLISSALLILSASLECNDPLMFFSDSTGQHGGPLSPIFVYDAERASGKCLRVAEQTSLFGAAKISGMLERRLANRNWEFYDRETGKTVYGPTLLGDIKTCGLSDLFTDDSPLVRYSPLGSRRFPDATRRVTRGTLAEVAVGACESCCFEDMLSARGNADYGLVSELWDEYGMDPPTFHGYKLPEVESTITSDVVARTFCYLEGKNNILSKGVLLQGGANALYGCVLDGTKEDILSAFAYDAPPLVRADYGGILSKYMNTNALVRKGYGRFDYEKSRAEAWLVAMNDARVVPVYPNALVKVFNVEYSCKGKIAPESGVDEVTFAWDSSDEAFAIRFKKETKFSTEVEDVTIVTNFVEHQQVDGLYTEVKGDSQTFVAAVMFDMTISLNRGDLLAILPDDGKPHGLHAEKTSGPFVSVGVSDRSSAAMVDKSINIGTNAYMAVQSERRGTGRYSGDSKSFVIIDGSYSKVGGLPDWLYNEKFIKSSKAYYASRCESMDGEPYEISQEALRSIEMSDTSSGNNYEQWCGAYDSVLHNLEMLQQIKTQCNLREGFVLPYNPMNNGGEGLKGKFEGAVRIHVPESIGLSGTYYREGDEVFRNGTRVTQSQTFTYPLSSGESMSFSDPPTNSSFYGKIDNLTKVMYKFRNLNKNEGD